MIRHSPGDLIACSGRRLRGRKETTTKEGGKEKVSIKYIRRMLRATESFEILLDRKKIAGWKGK